MASRAVLDEFTAPAEKAVLLERSRLRIEGLFGVSLAVLGALEPEQPLPARIWLQLRGAQEAVHSAKVSPRPRAPGRPLAPARCAVLRGGSRPRPPLALLLLLLLGARRSLPSTSVGEVADERTCWAACGTHGP